MRYAIDNQSAPIDFAIGSDDIVARTLQNAKNLLMTHMGEIPYDRLRGFDAGLFDLPLPRLNEQLLPELDRVMLWEPDVTVISATATPAATSPASCRPVHRSPRTPRASTTVTAG